MYKKWVKRILYIALCVAAIIAVAVLLISWKDAGKRKEAEASLGPLYYSKLTWDDFGDDWQTIDNNIYQMDYKGKDDTVFMTLPEDTGGAESLCFGDTKNVMYCLCWKDAETNALYDGTEEFLNGYENYRRICSIIKCNLETKERESTLTNAELAQYFQCDETEVNISDLSYIPEEGALLFVRNHEKIYKYDLDTKQISIFYECQNNEIYSYQVKDRVMYIIQTDEYLTPASTATNSLVIYDCTTERERAIDNAKEVVSLGVNGDSEGSVFLTEVFSLYKNNLQGEQVKVEDNVDRILKVSEDGKYILASDTGNRGFFDFPYYDCFILNLETKERIILKGDEILWKVCQ